MPSIYTQLRSSDRKHIRTEKARIRREFLDLAKQEELISALYVKMLGKPAVAPVVVKEAKADNPRTKRVELSSDDGKPKKVEVKKEKKVKVK